MSYLLTTLEQLVLVSHYPHGAESESRPCFVKFYLSRTGPLGLLRRCRSSKEADARANGLTCLIEDNGGSIGVPYWA